MLLEEEFCDEKRGPWQAIAGKFTKILEQMGKTEEELRFHLTYTWWDGGGGLQDILKKKLVNI